MKKEKNNIPQLTEQEERFCELYVYGGSKYAGQLTCCYEEVFGERKNVSVVSRKFIAKPHIFAKVKELTDTLQSETEHLAIKIQVTETLKAVMEETATAIYDDKFGNSLSPAPLRAVAVNAAKALMDLYPIKHIHETRLRIEADKGGVIFNVVVPDIKQNEEENFT